MGPGAAPLPKCWLGPQIDARYWYSNYVCPSVRPSVCPSRFGILSKLLNILSWFLTTRWPNHSSFMSIKQLCEIPTGSPPPPAGALNITSCGQTNVDTWRTLGQRDIMPSPRLCFAWPAGAQKEKKTARLRHSESSPTPATLSYRTQLR